MIDAEMMGVLRSTVPNATPEDAGAAMVVGQDGKWTKGEIVNATITVEDHGLYITAAE